MTANIWQTEAPRDPPFWIIKRMRPNNQISKFGKFFRHSTSESAHTEAQRLSDLFPGAQFVVLLAVASYCEPVPVVTPLEQAA